MGRLIYIVKHTQRILLKKVQAIGIDNEFATLAFIDFSTQEGVKHERLVLYESHQNCVAQRGQRTISAKARTL